MVMKIGETVGRKIRRVSHCLGDDVSALFKMAAQVCQDLSPQGSRTRLDQETSNICLFLFNISLLLLQSKSFQQKQNVGSVCQNHQEDEEWEDLKMAAKP